MQFTNSKTGLGLYLFSILQLVTAHSWVEQLTRIGPDGAYIGEPGYPRGFVPRGPGFNDDLFVHLLPPNDGRSPALINDKDLISKNPDDSSYTDQFPMLKASPGDLVALRYQENGHVSIPSAQKNKPLNRGTVYIYGTTDLRPTDTLLGIHHQWTPDGKGGDGRGQLLATRNYDDGQCRQTNSEQISVSRTAEFPKSNDPLQGADLWCQNDIQLPNDIELGSKYHLVWVWDWPTLKNPADFPKGDFPTQGEGVDKPEVYTSVSTVEIVAPQDGAVGGNKQLGKVNQASFENRIGFNDSTDRGQRAIQSQLQEFFDVPVDGASGANEQLPQGQPAPSQGNQPTEASPSHQDGGRTKTVTKTMEPTTFTSFVTVTIQAGKETPGANTVAQGQVVSAQTTNYAAPEATDVVSNVEPFMLGRRRSFVA